MKKIITLVVLAICISLSAQSLHGQNRQNVIELSSPLYRLMDSIYLESGQVHPDKARPWTGRQALFILDRVDPSGLSRAGRNSYDHILTIIGDPDRKRLVEFGDQSRLTIDAGLNAEFFSRSNLDSDSAMKSSDYLRLHGYEERKPLLTIPFELFVGDSIYMLSEMSVKEEHGTVIHDQDNFSNLVFDDPNARIDLYFPFRAFLSTGGEWWNFQFGRDSISWGNGHSGNMLISDFSDYYDFGRLDFYSGRFRLSSVYAVMDPYTPLEKPTGGAEDTTSHAFLGRRLDIRITDRILLSLNEAVTIGMDEPNLVKDLNYLMIFHNWTTPERMNSLMTAELSIAPWRYFNLYGQAAMDEYRTQYEDGGTGGGGPPIFGYLAGVEGVYPLGDGYLSAVLEWAQTSPWLYHRREAPYFYNVRKYWSLTTDGDEYVVKPIGYEYGPDSVVWLLETRYDVPGGISALASITWLRQGERRYLSFLDPDFNYNWDGPDGDGPDEGVSAPSGTAQSRLILHLAAEYPFRPWLTAGAGIYYSAINKRDNVRGQYSHDLELTCFFSFKLPRTGKID